MTTTLAFPAGPSAHPWIQTLSFSQDPLGYVRETSRRFGDTYVLRMSGLGRIVLFSEPEAVRRIFGLSATEMRNGNDVVRYLLHDRSIIFLEGEEHKTYRKLLTPPFHGAQLAASAGMFMNSMRRACAGWTNGETVNLHRTFQRATLDALLTAIFGETEIPGFERLRSELLDYVNGQLTNGMFFASVLFGPRLSSSLRARTARAKADLAAGRAVSGAGLFARRAANLANVEILLDEVIQRRKTEGSPGNDALGRMLASGAVSDEDIRHQILTLLVAGHDTTSLALSWLTLLVLDNPAVLRRLMAELKSARSADGLDPALVAELPYLGAVIDESLRHTPIAAFAPRRMNRDVEIGRVVIPAGTYFAANIIGAHARAETWGDPEAFRPERFLGVEPLPWSFIPFGGGVRRCLGAAFATAEMRFVFAQLLSDWEIQIAPGYRAKPAVHGFLIGPAKPLRVIVRRRTVG